MRIRVSKKRWIIFSICLILLAIVSFFAIYTYLTPKDRTNTSLLERTSSVTSQAKSLSESGDANGALNVLQKAIDATSNNTDKAEYMKLQASIISSSGDTDRAAEVSGSASSILGKSTSSNIKTDEYKTYYDGINEILVRIKADYPDIQGYSKKVEQARDFQNIAYLYSLVGDKSSALDYYKKSLEIYKSSTSINEHNEADYIQEKIDEIEKR